MPTFLRLLLVEDNEDDELLLKQQMKEGGYELEIERVETLEGLRSALKRKNWDCIISDYSLPNFSGLAAMHELRSQGIDIPFIIVSGTIGEETAVEAMKAGAHDYIMKGKLMRLIPALERELAEAEVRRKRKQVEGELRESEYRYRDLVQYSHDLIATHDLSGKILSVNPAVSRFSGYSEEELLEMNLRDLLDPEVRHLFDDYLNDIRTKGTTSGSMRVRSKTGEKRIWEYDNSLRERENEEPIVRSTTRDVTERRRAEQMILQAQKVEAIGQLAGGVAHDFNNILMAITGYCELILMKTGAQESLIEPVSEIKKVATQGAALTRQLLAFSRKQAMEPTIIDLNDVIKKMEGLLRRLIKENIELRFHLHEDLAAVKADAGQIEQVVLNLVINSGDAVVGRGAIDIETLNLNLQNELQVDDGTIPPGDYVLISIKDNGIGMNEITLRRIFEPFFTTKEQGKGTGLGLSTVYGIVKQTGGHISVESTPGHGTTFTVYLPREEGDKPIVSSIDSSEQTIQQNGKGCILLVDDNDSVRNAVSTVLQMCGYNVLTATNGQHGLYVSAKYPGKIDLVITDLVMPQMGGYEFVDQLMTTRFDIKVIYITGYSAEFGTRQTEKKPDAVHLLKPTPIAVLMQTIRRLIPN